MDLSLIGNVSSVSHLNTDEITLIVQHGPMGSEVSGLIAIAPEQATIILVTDC